MQVQDSTLFRIKRRFRLYFEPFRDWLEWHWSLLVTREAVWCRNRLGQHYQPISLPEYRYMRNGNPERNVSLLTEKLLQKGMTVVDIGANHGLFSLEAAQFVGSEGHVYAFEPTPKLCSQLKKHFQINQIEQICLFEQAVSNFDGMTQLRVHEKYTGLNSLAEQDLIWQQTTLVADQVIDVPVCQLDTVVNTLNIDQIDLLKVDVEGFESAVLEGASGILTEGRARYILLEIADCHERNSALPVNRLLKVLDQFGYVVHFITPEGEIGEVVKDQSCYSGGGGNFVCLRSANL
jgi:FkbM family methyltransferase